ncbi:MAG: hypothetical protein ACERKV_04130 [Clostridiaceae bacterium]
MDNEKLLFKCTMTRSLKDINEATKIISKKRILITKILLNLWLIMIIVLATWYLVHYYDLLFIEAIDYIFSYKYIIILYILALLCIWKLVEVRNWIGTRTGRINKKNFGISNSYINFYETFFEDPFFLKSASQAKVNYSDLTNLYITKNLYIVCIYKYNALIYNTYIRKDSFIEGNEQEFVKFIQSKTNIQ